MTDNLPPSSADVTESGSLNLPEPSAPHRPVMGMLYLTQTEVYNRPVMGLLYLTQLNRGIQNIQQYIKL
jgi:hypothetical protein